MAKHKHLSFKVLNERCLSPFECIHNDIWGPCLISSIFRCTWFIIFVDDRTCVTWLYVVKSKAEVSQVVLQFCEMITNQFGGGIKHFQSNNAKEFFNSIVNSYFVKRDVIHESSRVNTPQQNGREELVTYFQ